MNVSLAHTQRGAKRQAVLWLIAAIMLGGALRCYLAWSASVIARDGVAYVSMARRMSTDWRAGIDADLQFGYPLLICWAYHLGGSRFGEDDVLRWQRVGQTVSLLSGLVCITAIYCLGRRLISRRVGLLAAWIWALLPEACRLSADVLTDTTYLAFALCGIVAAATGLRVRSIGHLLWAGILSGASYAIRPEGGEVALVAVALASVCPGPGLRWRVTAVAAVVGGFAIFGGSYIWIENGEVFSEMPGLLKVQVPVADPCRPCLALGSWDILMQAKPLISALVRMTAKMSDTLNGIWLILGCIYLFLPGRPRLRRSWLPAPLAVWILHAVVLLWLHMRLGYLSRRYVMLLDVGLVILAAATISYWGRWLSMRIRAHRLVPVRWADAMTLGAISLALIPWLLRDINDERWYIREAAEWIKIRHRNDWPPTVVAQYPRVPFYAGLSDWIHCRWPSGLAHLPNLAAADLVIMDVRTRVPQTVTPKVGHQPTRLRLVEVARFLGQREGSGVVLYRVEKAVKKT